MNKFLFLCIISLCFITCKSDSNLVDYDLLKHGLSIKIKTPIDPEVIVKDMGIAKDVTIKKGEDFNIQLISSSTLTYDVGSIIAEKKTEVENGPYFSQIIQENENGFVFEKKIDDENINYDFRVVRIVGDTEYDFQTSLLGKFSKEEAIIMYEAVQ